MLNRVQISDYRCLRKVDVPLSPLTVLIGPNDTGKSTFLSAVQLLGTAPLKGSNDLPVASSDLWGFLPTSLPTITGHTTSGKEVLVQRWPPQKPLGERSFWVRTGDNSDIAPVNFFNSSILMPATESQGAEGKSGVLRIDDKAKNLPAYLDVLLRKDRERFFRIRDTLRSLIPGLNDLNIETPSAQNRRIDLKLENDITMDAQHASYGVKLMIFFVALANHPDPPRTVLLEEPETGVHPKRLVDIVRLLVALSEGVFSGRPTQVIVTTHSPYLLDCIDPKKHKVLVLQREEDGACSATPISNDRLSPFMDEFMLGEVWLNQEEPGLIEKVG